MTLTRDERHEVAAGILVRGRRVLLGRCREDKVWHPGAWDLVGGHIESGESPIEALRREGREEFAIHIEAPRHLMTVEEPALVLHVYVVTRWHGVPRNAAPDEHAEIRWFESTEIERLQLVDERWLEVLCRVFCE